MQQKGPAARRGFTLMETLAVVALIVVLPAVALPSLGKAGCELRGDAGARFAEIVILVEEKFRGGALELEPELAADGFGDVIERQRNRSRSRGKYPR